MKTNILNEQFSCALNKKNMHRHRMMQHHKNINSERNALIECLMEPGKKCLHSLYNAVMKLIIRPTTEI